jgi:hypothetical protein
MNLGYFLGGAILGAAGLTAAALIDDKLNPKPSLPDPDDARSMSVERVTSGLSAYCMRAAALNTEKTASIRQKVDAEPMRDFEDDGILDRMRNRLGGGVCLIDRKLKVSSLRDFLSEAEKLYKQHRCLFVRANVILREHGIQGVSLKTLAPRKRTFTLDNSVSNNDWHYQFDDSLEVVQDFITATIDAANLLCDKLEALSEPQTTDALPEGTAPATA